MIDLLPKDAVSNLQKVLSKKRYEHSVRVMETSFEIFDAWNLPEKLKTNLAWASLFHDCAKENPPKKQNEWLKKADNPYGMDLLDSPNLVHGTVGSIILEQEYGIQDQDVLTAVAYHSTGHPDQSALGWIVYTADILEPGRTFIDGRKNYLQTVCNDPLEGLRQVTDLRHSISSQNDRPIHPTAMLFKKFLYSIKTVDSHFKTL